MRLYKYHKPKYVQILFCLFTSGLVNKLIAQPEMSRFHETQKDNTVIFPYHHKFFFVSTGHNKPIYFKWKTESNKKENNKFFTFGWTSSLMRETIILWLQAQMVPDKMDCSAKRHSPICPHTYTVNVTSLVCEIALRVFSWDKGETVWASGPESLRAANTNIYHLTRKNTLTRHINSTHCEAQHHTFAFYQHTRVHFQITKIKHN